MPVLNPNSDGPTVVQTVEAIRADIGTLHGVISTAEAITTALKEDLVKSKETIEKYAAENEKVKMQLKDAVVNHDRDVGTLKSEMGIVQARL